MLIVLGTLFSADSVGNVSNVGNVVSVDSVVTVDTVVSVDSADSVGIVSADNVVSVDSVGNVDSVGCKWSFLDVGFMSLDILFDIINTILYFFLFIIGFTLRFVFNAVDSEVNKRIQLACAKFPELSNLLQNFDINLWTRISILNCFVRSRPTNAYISIGAWLQTR